MAVTINSDFKIREELLYSMFQNRTIVKTEVFNANSNGALLIDSQRLSGEAPKTSQVDETAGLVSRRDVFGAITALTDKKIVESQVGGPKIRKTLGPVAVTQETIYEKGWTEADIANHVGSMFAKQILENAVSNVIKVLGAIIGKSANKHRQTKAIFNPKNMLDALKYYGENEELWALSILHSQTYVKGLETIYDDKVNDMATLALREGRMYAVGRPVLKTDNASMSVADADSTAGGAQPGKWIFFLPRNAFRVVVSRPPTIVQQVVTGMSQLFIRFQAEYNHILQPRQHEWVGAAKNPTDAQLIVPASWEDRAKSHVGSVGFGLQVRDTV